MSKTHRVIEQDFPHEPLCKYSREFEVDSDMGTEPYNSLWVRTNFTSGVFDQINKIKSGDYGLIITVITEEN
jgi:hypothetical protein